MNKKVSKRGKEFGSGIPEGVAASEAANNSAAAGAFAPLLALGIPGSGTAAVLLSGLMMWGLTPGPQLFTEQSDFCWGLISSMYVGNILCLAMAMARDSAAGAADQRAVQAHLACGGGAVLYRRVCRIQ